MARDSCLATRVPLWNTLRVLAILYYLTLFGFLRVLVDNWAGSWLLKPELLVGLGKTEVMGL
jgi:hypothetical protein